MKTNVVRMAPDWFSKRREPGEKVTIHKRRKLASKYYGLREMADKFGCGYDVLYKAIRRGELEAEVVGRSYKVSDEAMEQYLDLCRKRKSI